MIDARTCLRAGLVRLPWLADAKARAYYGALRLVRRPFEKEFKALQPHLQPGMLCLDVGANHGQSVDALRMMNRGVRVLAFEPQPQLYERLRRRFSACDGVEVRPWGAGDRPGRCTLWVPSYNGYVFDGLASTSDERSAVEWLSYSMHNYDPSKLSVATYEVEIVCLDDVVDEPVGAMKIDIQGAELPALQGARRILTDDRPIVMIEQSSAGPIDEFMSELEYLPHTWSGDRLTPGIGALNTIYVPAA